MKKATELCGDPDRNRDKNEPSLNEVFLKLRQNLSRSKKASDYIKGRNLNTVALEIGYNHYGTDYKQLQNCIIFPLKEKLCHIVSLYGRSISDKKNAKPTKLVGRHCYLKNRNGLYPNYPSEETKTIIITEAIIDAATLLSYTDFTVLSLFGTNGWNEEHPEAIKSLNHLEEIIFFMDGDEAGCKAKGASAVLKHKKAKTTSVKVIKLFWG